MNAFTGPAGGLRGATSPAIRESLLNVEDYQSERPIGDQETARMWCHTKCDGPELFRGSYVKYRAARHYHTVPAIGIVAHGAMTSYYRGATHTLPTGTVFLINPGEVHAPGPVTTDGWILRVFYFEDGFYQNLSENFGRNPLRFSHVFVHDQALTDHLLALHQCMEDYSDSLEIDSAFLSIFGRFAERYAYDKTQSSEVTRETNKIDRVKQFIEAYYLKNPTLKELAVVADLSPYHLLRTFQKTVGLTPHAYLNQTRIEVAMKFLREGKAIAETAFDTGFTDQSHFTRNFRRMMGVTPGRFHAGVSNNANSLQASKLRRNQLGNNWS